MNIGSGKRKKKTNDSQFNFDLCQFIWKKWQVKFQMFLLRMMMIKKRGFNDYLWFHNLKNKDINNLHRFMKNQKKIIPLVFWFWDLWFVGQFEEHISQFWLSDRKGQHYHRHLMRRFARFCKDKINFSWSTTKFIFLHSWCHLLQRLELSWFFLKLDIDTPL
jgi:hypothetical protein